MIDYLEHGRLINDAYFAGKLRWLQRGKENRVAVFRT